MNQNPSVPESNNTGYEPVETSAPQIDESKIETVETTNFTEDVWSTPATNTSQEIIFETAPTKNEPESESLATAPVELGNTDDDNANVASYTIESEVESEAESEPDLFVDRWLDENEETTLDHITESNDELNELKQEKVALEQEIAELRASKEQLFSNLREAQENMGRLIEEGTRELQERKTALRVEIDKLERRKERIDREMRSNFAGSSKELAIRVQGFKEYLVGSLQDLASAAEKLELAREAPARRERVSNPENLRSNRDRDENNRNRARSGDRDRNGDRTRTRDISRDRNRSRSEGRTRGNLERSSQTQFSESTFTDQSRRIRQLLDKYCNSPDYYGAPWQLRRTFDENQAKKVQNWFFSQGGRGAVDSTGSRLQNILVASAVISILHDIYRDRTQVLVLTDTPENLGEWRKGLEDCLGISRRDFGANRGVVLFDSPEVLVQRAERLLADKLLPVIIIDETEDLLNLSMLKFPIWLAFAATNKPSSSNYLY